MKVLKQVAGILAVIAFTAGTATSHLSFSLSFLSLSSSFLASFSVSSGVSLCPSFADN